MNQGQHEGFQSNQGPTHSQGASSNQKYPKCSRHIEEMVGDMVDAQAEQRVAMDMLTKQLSQMASTLNEIRENEGKLPAAVKVPDKTNIRQITLRSGREYAGPSRKDIEDESPKEEREAGRQDESPVNPMSQRAIPTLLEPDFEEAAEEDEGKGKLSEETGKKCEEEPSHTIKLTKPFPYRGEARSKKEDPMDFMEMFSQMEIKLPLLQALKFPPISCFVKNYMAEKIRADEKIVIEENASALIQKRDLLPKRADPGMFTLPIKISEVEVNHAMCDLGASINVLPFAIYHKLRGVEIVEMKVVIQLADRSCIRLERALEDVMVKVKDFLYPADFYVIRISEPESNGSSGVLLGRSFLRTTCTIIDVFDRTICLDFHGEKFTFNIDEAMRKPMDAENLSSIDVIAPLVQEYLEEELIEERLVQSNFETCVVRNIAGWCEKVKTREMTDEEISEAINEFYKRPYSAGSVGAATNGSAGLSRFAQLTKLEKQRKQTT